MKAIATTIAKTELTPLSATLTIQPEGSDQGFNQFVIHVNPSREGVTLFFSGLGDRVVQLGPPGANQASVVFKTPVKKKDVIKSAVTATPISEEEAEKRNLYSIGCGGSLYHVSVWAEDFPTLMIEVREDTQAKAEQLALNWAENKWWTDGRRRHIQKVQKVIYER